MSTATSNPYQEKARLEKAKKLANLCQGWDVRSYDVAGFSEQSWGLLAEAARVKAPSDDTQAMVIRMLRERELAGAASLERDRR